MARPLSYPEFGVIPGKYRGVDFLYALETSKGQIKVGRSALPRNRLTQHANALKKTGQRVMRFHVEPAANKDSYASERELIARLTQHGVCVPGTCEWFVGLSWGIAFNLLRQIARRQFLVLAHSSASCTADA